MLSPTKSDIIHKVHSMLCLMKAEMVMKLMIWLEFVMMQNAENVISINTNFSFNLLQIVFFEPLLRKPQFHFAELFTFYIYFYEYLRVFLGLEFSKNRFFFHKSICKSM